MRVTTKFNRTHPRLVLNDMGELSSLIVKIVKKLRALSHGNRKIPTPVIARKRKRARQSTSDIHHAARKHQPRPIFNNQVPL